MCRRCFTRLMECLVVCTTLWSCHAICELELNLATCTRRILDIVCFITLNNILPPSCWIWPSLLFLVYLASLPSNHMSTVWSLLHLRRRRSSIIYRIVDSMLVVGSTCGFARLLNPKSYLIRILPLFNISEALIVIRRTATLILEFRNILLIWSWLGAHRVNCSCICWVLNCWCSSYCAFFLLHFSFWSTPVWRQPTLWKKIFVFYWLCLFFISFWCYFLMRCFPILRYDILGCIYSLSLCPSLRINHFLLVCRSRFGLYCLTLLVMLQLTIFIMVNNETLIINAMQLPYIMAISYLVLI